MGPVMAEVKVLIFLAVIGLAIVLCGRFRVMPFLALLIAALLFGFGRGADPQWIGKFFNTGFGQTIAFGGLSIVAGAMVAALGQASGAVAAWQARLGDAKARGLALVLAFFAGFGGTPIGALAAFQPVLALVQSGRTRLALQGTAIIHAVQGALIPAPLPIAAIAILEADWKRALLFGILLAAVQIAVSLWLTRNAPEGTAPLPAPRAEPSTDWARRGFMLALITLIVLVIFHALGQIPAEPLGGGSTRERLFGSGRPLILFFFALGIALIAMGRHAGAMLSENGPLAEAARASAGVVLAVGAAGGLQMVAHSDGFTELIVEKVAALPRGLGLAIPFLIALVSRALQGSPLAATITAAGIMQPLVEPFGLGSEAGRVLTALASACGALSLPHLNDGAFWLARHKAGISVPAALRWVTGIALAQTLAGLMLLILLAKLFV